MRIGVTADMLETSAPSARAGQFQAVILAAGFAKRMQPLSDHCHKALLPIGGTTILGRIMDHLRQLGIARVTVVTGYRADDIERFLYDWYPDIDLRLVHNPRYRETNNVVSMSLALDGLTYDADIIQIECDLIFDLTILQRLINHSAANVALVDKFRTGMDGTVVEVHDGYLSNLYTTDAQGANFSFADKFKTLKIYRFERQFCQSKLQPLLHEYAYDIDPSCFYELVLGKMIIDNARLISADIVAGESWAEVDDPNDIAITPFMFLPEQRAAILDETPRGHWNFDILDFSVMRNMYFPSGVMLAMMRHALPDLISNHCSDQQVLNEKLSYFLRCDRGRLQVLHGTSQLFPILRRCFAQSSMLIPTPTLNAYAKAFPNAETYFDAPGVEWDELAERAPGYDVVVMVNPNTSSGTALSSEAIHALARSTPKTLFWVNESFLAFSDQPSLVTLLEVEPIDNVLVMVSLSSRLGVPGLRLGFAYSCNPTMVEAIGAELPAWNLTAPGEYFLELLVKFTAAYASSLQRTVTERESFRADLESLPIVASVPRSGANFLLIQLEGSKAELAGQVRRGLLERHCIEVRDVSSEFPDVRPRLRVAVRSNEENTLLVDVLKDLPQQLSLSLA